MKCVLAFAKRLVELQKAKLKSVDEKHEYFKYILTLLPCSIGVLEHSLPP